MTGRSYFLCALVGLGLVGCTKPKPFRHLVEVLRDGDFQRARELIAEGKQRGEYSNALQVACVNHGTNQTLLQNLPIIRALLDAGADPDASERDGFTLLWLMAGSPEPGSGTALQMLIDAGAALNVQEKQHGSTPLINAAEAGSIPKVRRLLKAGADPKIWNHHGENALMRCATNCVPILVRAGLDVNAMVSKSTTVLMWAAGNGLDLKVRALVAHGAKVDAGSMESMKRDGNSMRLSCRGLTALMYAANRGHTKVVRALLKAGADVDATSVDGWTALMLATAGGHKETARVIREHGADAKGLNQAKFVLAVRRNDTPAVKALLQKGASVNLRTPFLQTPLEIAAGEGHDEVLRVLLQAGADLARQGERALRIAESAGHRSAAKILRNALQASVKPVPTAVPSLR